jgi:hypothetical protein
MAQREATVRVRLLLFVLALAGCTPAKPTIVPADVPVDSAFDLTIGQSIRVQDPETVIRLISVPEDSRCPTSGQCIWAGNGRVRLVVASADRADTIDLNTTLDPHERAAGQLTVRLVALNPPRTDPKAIPPADYRATLIASVRPR